MEWQQGVSSSAVHRRRNAKHKVKEPEHACSDDVATCGENETRHRPKNPNELYRSQNPLESKIYDDQKGIGSPANTSALPGDAGRRPRAPHGGRLYHFSRGERVRKSKNNFSTVHTSEQIRPAEGHGDVEKEIHREPDFDSETDQRFEPDQEPEPDLSDRSDFSSENGRWEHSQHSAQSQNPTNQQPVDWMDHPITQALAAFMEEGGLLNPVQIIADSVGSVTARGRQQPRPDWDPQPEHPEKIPVTPMPADQSDETVERVASSINVRDTFWDLWLGHQDQMRSQCIRLMAGNVADAEDALSSAMLRASQKFPSYADSIINGRAWLRKLVYNVCMDHYRQGKFIEYRPFDRDIDIPINGAMFTQRQQSPEEIALSREQISELNSCINSLSNNLRVPLFLRCVEGWSYLDIATT